MKNLSWIAVILVVGSAVFGTSAEAQSLGDIRYSVLDSIQFQRLHGAGWIMMDGRPIQKSDLCTELEICQVPDARGVFIRGMNMGRAAATGDPEGDRAVGGFQADVLGRHQHTLPSPLDQAGHTVNGNGTRARIDVDDGPPYSGIVWNTTTNFAGATETRPRNVALYMYIKINR